MKQLLNIGGGSKEIPIPDRYKDYEHLILDVTKKADYQYNLLDLMKEGTLPDSFSFDACYMSHMLEHFYPPQIVPILKFIRNKLLKPEGFLELKVPDVGAIMKHIVKEGMSLIDPLYKLPSGISITTLDILYGCQKLIRDGNDYQIHKMAFDKSTLEAVLHLSGFTNVEWLVPTAALELNCLCRF